MIIAVFLLTSCFPEPEVPPYGVWVSDEPNITLFINLEHQIIEDRHIYFGIYTVDNIDKKVFVQFGTGRHFVIYDLSEPRWKGEGVYSFYQPGGGGRAAGVRHSGSLFAGPYNMRRGEIHSRLAPIPQNTSENDIIIFRRIEDYEPIDPDWIANFIPN